MNELLSGLKGKVILITGAPESDLQPLKWLLPVVPT